MPALPPPAAAAVAAPRGRCASQPPPLSVTMGVYNSSAYLRTSVTAILQQSFGDFELVLIDDGSSDDSLQLCHHFARADGRVRVMSQANGGFGGVPAINRALATCQGSLIARCDADDVWLPDKLADQLAFMRAQPHLVATFTHAACIDDDDRPCEPPFAGCFAGEGQGQSLAHRLLRGNMLCHSTAIFRRDAFLAVGPFRCEHYLSTDHDLWLRLAAYGDLAILPQVKTLYRIHTKNVSFGRPQAANRSGYQVIMKNFAAIHRRWPLPGSVLEQSLRVMAFAAYQATDFAAAHKFFTSLARHRALDAHEAAALALCQAAPPSLPTPRSLADAHRCSTL